MRSQIPFVSTVLLANIIACGSDANLRPIGGKWFVEDQPSIIEAGRQPRSLVYGTRRRHATVSDMLERQEYYEPDCVVYQTARHSDIFVVCGEHTPLAIASSITWDWKFEPDGLRRVSNPVSSASDGLVREVDLIPFDTLRTLAMQQPRRVLENGEATAFDASNPPVAPIRTDSQESARSDPAALVKAVTDNQLPLVRALLAAGADPSAHNDRNISALMIACGRGDTLMVDALIAAGASVTAEDNTGRTPMAYARFFASEEIRARLRKAGATR
jgi:hypothetical protein